MTTSRFDRSVSPWPARAGWLAVALGVGGPLAAQEVTLPSSGLAAALFDVVLEDGDGVMEPDAFTDAEASQEAPLDDTEPLDAPPLASASAGAPPAGPSGGLARFRLVVPGLGEAGYDQVAADFRWICEALALPALAANGWVAAEVVVSLSDREVAFGATDPAAVQFFEGFRIAEGTCVPQAF